MAEEKVFGEKWRVVGRPLGRGGQGVVYKVEEITYAYMPRHLQVMRKAISETIGGGTEESHRDSAITLVNTLKALIIEQPPRIGAAKELLPMDEAINATSARDRMKTELSVLKDVSHPSLIRVLDDNLDENWFVTEYFREGALDRQMGRYAGRVLDALTAIRPLVDAVSHLHKKDIVHRDIKPDNVFVADDGRLVLGDCGLAIRLEDEDRITNTYENVGSRDWMPGWAHGMRLEDVKPNFDVFSLGKLLWAMVSGRPRLRLWYFDRPPFDLRHLFPDVPEMNLVHRILAKCVVEHEDEMKCHSVDEVAAIIDETIMALQTGGTVPSRSKPFRCHFCGIGHYRERSDFRQDGFFDPADRRYLYICENCGHVAQFHWTRDNPPRSWIE